MKKKIWIFIILLVSIVSVFVVFKVNAGARTVEEAIHTFDPGPKDIIYQEKNDQGTIVFYSHLHQDDLVVAVVSKKLTGHEVVYNGLQVDIEKVTSEFALTLSYLPAIEDTALPLFFGLVSDSDITKIEVTEEAGDKKRQAEIITVDDMKIWLMYMKGFEGSKFEIVGLSDNGEEVVKIDEDISPYQADQKPFKSDY
ncbi:hypothetical protein GCM10011351_00450 [Paraliobacillus quinghaiensis]|uniref:Uncharacterized protein n=1 Tax=Paraliobacillus quinghaiensis TaxID=470815 RepID=A0A917WPG4_9BACI|nr:hypothetical protein [Paraliobacillus quinghaiensis]GGM18577.1 hypothetical protein GCM10011351_00450 [Paraliobacillus quinghaiensis]